MTAVKTVIGILIVLVILTWVFWPSIKRRMKR